MTNPSAGHRVAIAFHRGLHVSSFPAGNRNFTTDDGKAGINLKH